MKYLLILILSCAIYSCTVDDNVIPAKPMEKEYIISENNSQVLSIYNSTSQSYRKLSDASFSEITDADTIVKIESFLKHSYILYNTGICLVLDNESQEIISQITMPTKFDKLSDIVFPNASSAYISSGLNGKIAIIDIANNKFVKFIEDSKSAAGMTYYGNKVYVCNTVENKIDVYDTRTDVLIKSQNTEKAPVLIDYSPDEDLFILITAGSGKYDNGNKSAARLNIYERDGLKFKEGSRIEKGRLIAEDQIPIGMGINDLSFVIIATQEGILRYNLRFSNSLGLVNLVSYSGMVHDTYSNKFLLNLKSETSNEVHVLDAQKLQMGTALKFDHKIDYIYPLID